MRFLFFCLCFLLAVQVYAAKNQNEQIVLTDGVRLRSSPSVTHDNVIGSVNTSEIVTVIDKKKVNGIDWVNVKTAVNQTGWIVQHFISPRGSNKISTYCDRVLKNYLQIKNITMDEQIISQFSLPQNSIKEIVSIANDNKTPLSLAGFYLLTKRDNRGVGVLIESLKEKKYGENNIFYALQVFANAEMLRNKYEDFSFWYSKNKKNIDIDDFSLVKVFYSLKQKL